MRRLVVLALLAGGCGFSVGASTTVTPDAAETEIDAAPEPDAPDAPALCSMWMPQHFRPCDIGTPKPPLVITAAASPWVYDTTTVGGTLRDKDGIVLMSPLVIQQSDNSMVAVLSVDSLNVEAGAVLNVIGPKPLIIASWDAINVTGTIDAGSTTGEIDNAMNAHIDGPVRTGAGANPTGRCGGMTGSPGAPAIATGGSGGGGGGAHRGDGGNGTTGDTTPQAGGPGGARLAAPPNVVRGGCAGGASGNAGTSTGLIVPATAATRSVGGAGGGAIELAARNSISISGRINAGGAGGAGAPYGSAVGGGGGGSGGYIGLDAPMVAITSGTLAANGGGGGGAAPYAGNGNQGGNALDASQALGGVAQPVGTCGLAGAAGSVALNLDAPDASGADSCGGGGGGGGAGFIQVWSPMFVKQNAVISPIEQQ